MRDEAEVRGHRRTYIGALPGQILQMMKKAGVRNPVFMLDEIDKMSTDFRGDPSAALLEVLDPEQNYMFQDHYLGRRVRPEPGVLHRYRQRPAHHPAGAPGPHGSHSSLGLHRARKDGDRQALPGSQADEGHGLGDQQIQFEDAGIQELIQYYTREAGVRNLEREVGNVCRKIARTVVNAQADKAAKKKETPFVKVTVTPEKVNQLLGPQKFRETQSDKKNEVGATVGLAWTEVGGSILTTEAAIMEGRGKLTLTGKLGDVMQESAQAAMSYVRSRAGALGLPRDFLSPPGYSLARSRGCDPERRPVGRYYDCDQYYERAHQHPGAGRYRHDRRNHRARARAPHRRLEGEAAGRPPPGNPRSDFAAG